MGMAGEDATVDGAEATGEGVWRMGRGEQGREASGFKGGIVGKVGREARGSCGVDGGNGKRRACRRRVGRLAFGFSGEVGTGDGIGSRGTVVLEADQGVGKLVDGVPVWGELWPPRLVNGDAVIGVELW